MTKILAIDPSTTCLGWAILEKKGKEIKAIEYGFKKAVGATHYSRIPQLESFLIKIYQQHSPETVVLEDVRKINHRSKIAAMCAGAIDYQIQEMFLIGDVIAPSTIKKTVTGNGSASKEDVQRAVPRLIKGVTGELQGDAADALAIGYTFLMGVK